MCATAAKAHLFFGRGAHIISAHDGAHVFGGLNGSQARHATSQHEHFRRGDLFVDKEREFAIEHGNHEDEGSEIGMYGRVRPSLLSYTLPAAVIWPAKNRSNSLAASITAR